MDLYHYSDNHRDEDIDPLNIIGIELAHKAWLDNKINKFIPKRCVNGVDEYEGEFHMRGNVNRQTFIISEDWHIRLGFGSSPVNTKIKSYK